jgi:spore coat polysaccharide biosynthesis protein SpsF (cytidylyltransferase family)
MITTLAILQARMSSTRLPGKVMEPILGRPMIERQIERLMRCRRVDQLIMATSNHPADDDLEILCRRLGVPCFRGDLENVLDRFYQAAKPYNPKHVVRLTGDCPLTDPRLIDELIDFYLESQCDYASNCQEPTLPDGLDAEIFSFAALEQIWKEAVLPSHLEHVTSFFRSNPERFKIGSYRYHKDLSALRWTVDESEDLDFVRRVYEELYPSNPEFQTEDILALLKREPELMEINRRFERNSGMKKSIEKDKRFLSLKRKIKT